MNIIVLLGIFYDEFLVKVLLKIEEAPWNTHKKNTEEIDGISPVS
jgi:hypothetical protein